MTRADLIRENEALHGLLAYACEALDKIAEGCMVKHSASAGVYIDTQEPERIARDVLAQIREGVVP